jgi:DNA-binding transcriptional regulator YiaG
MASEKEQTMKCVACQKPMRDGAVVHEFLVSGVKVRGSLPAKTCACGEQIIEGDALAALELAAAHALGQHGVRTAEAFRFMRKALALRAVDLGALIGIEPETISRWETDKRDIDVRAFALLAELVADRVAGRTDTEERLKRLANPPKSWPTVLDVAV